MIESVLKIALLSSAIACISYFYEFLQRDGMLLEWWRRILELKLPLHIAKPLGYCIYCFNMQLALWSMIFSYFTNNTNILESICISVFSHVILVHLLFKYP